MNAGGVSKACKSNGHYNVAIQGDVSGKRERNTLVTYLALVNNSWKRELIRDKDGGTSVIPIERFIGARETYGPSGSWRGNGPPSL